MAVVEHLREEISAVVRRLRRGNRVRGRAAVAATYATRRADIFARAESFVRELQAEFAEVARCQAVTAAIIAELGAW